MWWCVLECGGQKKITNQACSEAYSRRQLLSVPQFPDKSVVYVLAILVSQMCEGQQNNESLFIVHMSRSGIAKTDPATIEGM